MTIGIVAVLVMLVLAWRGYFSPAYYSPVDVTALYWHFVDIGLDLSAADALPARHAHAGGLPFLEEAAMAERTICAEDLRRRLRSADRADRADGGRLVLPAAGAWHIVIGLVIAAVQGQPGRAVFHARPDQPAADLDLVIAVACFWLGILLVLTLNDYFTRGMVPFMPGH